MNWEQRGLRYSRSAVLFRINVCWLAQKHLFLCVQMQNPRFDCRGLTLYSHPHYFGTTVEPTWLCAPSRCSTSALISVLEVACVDWYWYLSLVFWTVSNRPVDNTLISTCLLCLLNKGTELWSHNLTGFPSCCLPTAFKYYVFSPKADAQCRCAADNKIMVHLTSVDLPVCSKK